MSGAGASAPKREIHLAELELRDVEHVVDEADESVGVLEADREQLAIDRRQRCRLAEDELERAFDRRQRRPELVRDGRQELALERRELPLLRAVVKQKPTGDDRTRTVAKRLARPSKHVEPPFAQLRDLSIAARRRSRRRAAARRSRTLRRSARRTCTTPRRQNVAPGRRSSPRTARARSFACRTVPCTSVTRRPSEARSSAQSSPTGTVRSTRAGSASAGVRDPCGSAPRARAGRTPTRSRRASPRQSAGAIRDAEASRAVAA